MRSMIVRSVAWACALSFLTAPAFAQQPDDTAALRAEVGFLGFASSVAVYGHGQLPMREDDVPHPADSYGNAKLAVERELDITMRMQGLPYFAFRMHNVYGEWQTRSGDIHIPKLSREEPLRRECAHFLSLVEGKGDPLAPARQGLAVIRTLELLQESLDRAPA